MARPRLLFLGAGQIVLGILQLSFQVAANVVAADITHHVVPGYWAGVLCIISGAIGIVAHKKETVGWILLFLIMSVLSTVASLGLISISSWAIDRRHCDCFWKECSNPDTSITTNALLLSYGLVSLILLSLSTAVCCSILLGEPVSKLLPFKPGDIINNAGYLRYSRSIYALGISQCVLGIVTFGVSVGATVVEADVTGDTQHHIYPGYWCGILFIIAGAFGIVAKKKEDKDWMLVFMMCSVFALMASVGLLGMSAAGLHKRACHCRWNGCDNSVPSLACNCLLMLFGIFELINTVAVIVLCSMMLYEPASQLPTACSCSCNLNDSNIICQHKQRGSQSIVPSCESDVPLAPEEEVAPAVPPPRPASRPCSICCERVISVCLQPCGHTFCTVCAVELQSNGSRNCANCRTPITRIQPVFL